MPERARRSMELLQTPSYLTVTKLYPSYYGSIYPLVVLTADMCELRQDMLE